MSAVGQEDLSHLNEEKPDDQDERNDEMSSWLSCQRASRASTEGVTSTLQTRVDHGLDSDEAERRLRSHGWNQICLAAPDPLWKKYLEQFNQPFILLLLVSAFISVCMSQFDDALSITLAIVIVVTVGFVQEYRSEKTLERMKGLLPPVCHCIRDGSEAALLAKLLVPGDIVRLAIGDKIPADLRLLQVNELAVDESSFTGETEPKYKTSDAMDHRQEMSVSDMNNIAFQGTLVTSGSGLGVVVCTGENSQFGKVFKMMQAEEPPRTPLQESMDILGKQLTVYSLGVIGLITIVGCVQGRPVLDMFNVGVSLAVAAIPEGLPIVVTVTLAFGVMRMAKRNAIVKRLPTVETLGCVDWICSDKTGTLTSNEMELSNIVGAPDILGDSTVMSAAEGMQSRPADLNTVLEVGVVCNNAVKTATEVTGSPIEKAILNAAPTRARIEAQLQHKRVREIPFSSERKTMAVQCSRRGEILWFVKGAVEIVMEQCKFISENDQLVPLTDRHKDRLQQISNFLSGKECKYTLALARGRDLAELELVGLFAFHDPPRPQAKQSIQTLHESGVNVCMVTGDSRETAAAICAKIGLSDDDKTLVSGAQIDKMSDEELEKVATNCYCFYRTTPKHKVRIVKVLQSQRHVVGMTGDGVNDGVAIKKADIGISMGITGTDVCKEAADMILLDDDFSTILSAIEEGKCIFYNIRNFVRFQLSTSIAALMLISFSTLLDIPNPLNAMQILWINVIMDGPPAQSLGLEPVDHEVLSQPPRKKSEQILSRSLLINVLLSASIIIAGTLWVFKEAMGDGHVSARDTTMTFTCFVLFDMFNALSSRSQDRLIFEIGFFSNSYFCVAVALSVMGQLAVIYLPPLQYVFQTEPLAATDLLFLLGLSSSVFIACELKKFLCRLIEVGKKVRALGKHKYTSV